MQDVAYRDLLKMLKIYRNISKKLDTVKRIGLSRKE
jgi:hypothetical protein